MGWQDFSFVRDGNGCMVCSPAEAAELIASGALTASTPITIFLDDGRRKAMIAGDWSPLGLAKAAPPASPPALVPAAGEPVDSDALDAARQELASMIAQVSTSTAAVVGAAAAKAADAAPSAEAPVEPEEVPAPEPPPAPAPPRPTLVPPVPKPLPPPGPGKGWVVALTILALIGAVIVYGMIRNAKADEVRVVVTSTANVRDLPTGVNSEVKFSYQAGQELTGRWVPSLRDPTQRWLEFEVGGETRYVWFGNLREVKDE